MSKPNFWTCEKCGGEHDATLPWPVECQRPDTVINRGRPPQRSSLPSPVVIMDTMDAIQSQVDGKLYTSKSAIRASYKVHGVEEIGNDPARHNPFKRPPPETAKNVEALKKAQVRYDRGERAKNKNWSTKQGTGL